MNAREIDDITAAEPHNINIATYGLFLLILVYIGRVHELMPMLDKLPVGKILMGSCVLLYVLSPNKTGFEKLQTVPQFRYVIWIFVLSIITLPFAVWPGGSINYMTDAYLKIMLFFYLLVTAVNHQEEIIKVVWGVVASVFLLGAKALSLEKIGRLTVTNSYDPNDLAFVMVSMMPIVYYMMKSHQGIKRLFLFTTLLTMLMTVVYTGSRGGFLGLTLIASVILYRETKSIIRALFFVLVLSSLMVIVAPASYWDRIAAKDYNYQKGGGGRLDIWKNGAALMLKHPITGVGIGGFETAEGLSHGGFGKWSSAHNSFVQIGAELGIMGLILFGKLLASSIRSLKECWQSSRADAVPNWLLDGTEVALYGYVATGFFLSQAYSPVLYLLVGLTILVKLAHVSPDGRAVIT